MHANSHSRIGLGIIVSLIAVCTAGADIINIVENSSFETPEISNGRHWNIFASIPGWQLSRGPAIEIQRGVNGWAAADGAQLLELDADIDGPGGGMHGEDASTAIFQDLNTLAGQDYQLTFAFSPRPGVADNALEILWDGQLVDTLSADGRGLSNTDWSYHTYILPATDVTTRLEFGDLSESNSLGTFIDDISVTAHIPEPASLVLLAMGSLPLLHKR